MNDNAQPGQGIFSRRNMLIGTATAAAVGLIVPATAAQPDGGCAAGTAAGATPAPASTVGSVWWNELVAADPAQARTFYTTVLGWTAKVSALEDPSRPAVAGEEEYTLFLHNGEEVAGLTKASDGLRPGWLPYVHVASVDLAVADVLKNGGKVLRFPSDVAEIGRLAIIEDLAGEQLGVVQPTASMPG